MLKEDDSENRASDNSTPLPRIATIERAQEAEQSPPVLQASSPPPPPSQPPVAANRSASTVHHQQSPVFTGHSTERRQQQTTTTNPFHMQSRRINVIPANRQGQLNTQFLATLPGVLKIGEILLGSVSFILAICADRRSTSAAWAEHISFETTVVVTALLLAYVIFPHLTISNEQTRNGLIVVEMLFYSINALFYFIGIWLMVHLSASWTSDGRGAAIMNAILCVALTVLYAVETFIKIKTWLGEEEQNSHVTKKVPSPHIPPPPTQRRYDENNDLDV